MGGWDKRNILWRRANFVGTKNCGGESEDGAGEQTNCPQNSQCLDWYGSRVGHAPTVKDTLSKDEASLSS